jgi:hypothetical protein
VLVIQQAFRQVGCRGKILESLLVLDADARRWLVGHGGFEADLGTDQGGDVEQ